MAPKGAAYQRKHLLDLPTPEDSLASVSAYDRHELGMELAGDRIDSEEIWLGRGKAKSAKAGLSHSISVGRLEHDFDDCSEPFRASAKMMQQSVTHKFSLTPARTT